MVEHTVPLQHECMNEANCSTSLLYRFALPICYAAVTLFWYHSIDRLYMDLGIHSSQRVGWFSMQLLC